MPESTVAEVRHKIKAVHKRNHLAKLAAREAAERAAEKAARAAAEQKQGE